MICLRAKTPPPSPPPDDPSTQKPNLVPSFCAPSPQCLLPSSEGSPGSLVGPAVALMYLSSLVVCPSHHGSPDRAMLCLISLCLHMLCPPSRVLLLPLSCLKTPLPPSGPGSGHGLPKTVRRSHGQGPVTPGVPLFPDGRVPEQRDWPLPSPKPVSDTQLVLSTHLLNGCQRNGP